VSLTALGPQMRSTVRLVCIPTKDAAFALDAARIAERIPDALGGEAAMAWFCAALRHSYPSAEVHAQDDLARSDGDDPVWYVTKRERHFRIDAAVVVALSPRDAFDVYVDRVVEWQTAVRLEPRRVTDELVGREYAACYPFPGRQLEGRFRVLAADPPHSVAMEAAGSGIAVWYETAFHPDPQGTRVEVKGDYELPAQILTRVADRLGLERAIARDIDRANETFRRLCALVAASSATSSAATSIAG
jgi:Polyketide cyclase / dehydrase and lipid transport